MRHNLHSPNQISTPCHLENLRSWVLTEANGIEDSAVRSVALTVCHNLESFVRFPKVAVLLWHGCIRPSGSEKHTYPGTLKAILKVRRIVADARSNGPAIVAFLIGEGERPTRFGSNNAWSIHHLYSGKFPYIGRHDTFHAVKTPRHFTQSAGLVAVHPILDALCDEFPFVTWRLRAEAFLRFGYDPDHVFSVMPYDDFGFLCDAEHVILHSSHIETSTE